MRRSCCFLCGRGAASTSAISEAVKFAIAMATLWFGFLRTASLGVLYCKLSLGFPDHTGVTESEKVYSVDQLDGIFRGFEANQAQTEHD